MPKFDNIRTIGLKRHLDMTASDHNGLGYDMFIKLHEVSKIGPNNLARAFKVSKNTMLKWLAIYHDEQAVKK